MTSDAIRTEQNKRNHFLLVGIRQAESIVFAAAVLFGEGVDPAVAYLDFAQRFLLR
jgi:hypothetical protein